ncbi:glycine zipper domain-containing protein [Vibrio intestinalis]|uniref:glycine zipper domain-containing protein n=1 Tax=Vibrio intestinalis TaxID=2933291 RepID=UPI0021A5C810|nr:glycine zipper domain-containing protein [Vibrio intestinalis]
MNSVETLHSSAYVLLMELVKHELACEELSYTGLARLHLDVIEYVTYYLPDDYGVLSEVHSLYPDTALQATELVLTNMLSRSDTQEFIREVSDGFRMGSNPIRYFTREALKDVEDMPEYLQLRPVIRTSALPIVLSALDEMHSRGVEMEALLEATEGAFCFVQGVLDSNGDITQAVKEDPELIVACEQEYQTLVANSWEFGEVDGSIDTGLAKAGKVAGGVTGAIAGAKVGAVVGSVIPVFGTVIGAAVGGVAGNMVGKSLGEEVTRPDLNDDKSVERNDAFESGMKDASEYAKETVEEALDIGKALSKKASRFFSGW